MPDPFLPFQAAFESLEKRGGGRTPAWMRPLREKALHRFTKLGFPTPREEDWKYTNLAPFVKAPFRFRFEPFLNGLTREKIKALLLGPSKGPVVTFVNGLYSERLSEISGLKKGFEAGSLSRAAEEKPDVVERYLGRLASYEKNGLTALNTAFLQDGAFIHLPAGERAEEPIRLLFLSLPEEEPLMAQPRNLFVLERGAQAAVIETYLSLAPRSYFTNAVTEIVLQEEARLSSCKIQREAKESGCHVATTQVSLGRGSRFFSFSLSLGGKLDRENLNVRFDAEAASCVLNGLYLVSEGQHIDHHTLIEHTKPRGTSRQLYKGILKGKSTAVFNGKVLVSEGAPQTDAEQTNKNLLLSDEAKVDTKPQLEIFTDDVKCTHGAAVGQLDEDGLFYLRSRGMKEPDAERLLTYGFASEVIGRVGEELLRSEFDSFLWTWLEGKEGIRS